MGGGRVAQLLRTGVHICSDAPTYVVSRVLWSGCGTGGGRVGQGLRTDEGGCVPIPMRLLRTWQVARVELLSFEVVLWQKSGMGGG